MVWDEWIHHHATIYALTGERDIAMLLEWARLFDAAGFGPMELTEASDWLAVNNPPRFRNDHLQALLGRAKAVRTALTTKPLAELAGVAPGASCAICEGVGTVTVPNPKALARGKWADAAVTCCCPLGRWIKSQDRRGWQTLEDYENEVPDWQELTRKRKAELLAWSRSASLAGSLDATLGPILRAMRRAT